jgi:hypothetical protein
MHFELGHSIGNLIGGCLDFVYHGIKPLLPLRRDLDSRSERVKYLDTCLAMVSEATMADWLTRQAMVDLSAWGIGGAKTVADLLLELSKGESELRSDGCRVVRVVKVRILHGDQELINTMQASPPLPTHSPPPAKP